MPGREDYEERRQARINRLNSAAASAEYESNQRAKRAHDLVKDIPFGQPNIIGRPALPVLREKSARMMDKAVELKDTATYYAERAEAAESNRAISSDDPSAIDKLQAKLASLEAERDRVKTANREAKKTGGEKSAWYTLPYLSRDIKAIKERISKLQAVEKMPAEIIIFDGGEIESDPITNRVIIRYDDRQPDSVTAQLKANGFKWAPSVQGWQRIRTPGALRLAQKLCEADEIGPAL